MNTVRLAGAARPTSQSQGKDKERESVLEKKKIPPVDVSEIREAALQLESGLKESAAGTPRSGVQDCNKDSVATVVASFKAMGEFVRVVNNLVAPSSGREEDLSRDLAHVAMLGLTPESGVPEQQYFSSLYSRTHLGEDGYSPQIALPTWMMRLHPYFIVDASETKFPPIDVYLRQSQQVGYAYNAAMGEIGVIQKELAALEQIKAKSDAKGVENNYGVGIAKHKQQIADIRANFPALLERVTDVLPEDVQELRSAVKIRVMLRPEIAEFFIDSVNKLDEVLTQSLIDGGGPVTVPLPHFMDDGSAVVEQIEFGEEELKAVRNDATRRENLITLLRAGREMIQDLIPTLNLFRGGEAVAHNGARALNAPLGRNSTLHVAAMDALCEETNGGVRDALIKLFGLPITVQHDQEIYRIFERCENIAPMGFLTRVALLDPNDIRARSALAVMHEVPECKRGCDIIVKVRAALADKRYAEVTKVMTAEITHLLGAQDDLSSVIALTLLHAIARDETHALRLKKQISNLREIRTITAALMTRREELPATTEGLVDYIIKGMTPTLGDYYNGPGMDELNVAVEKFKILCEEPTILQGVEGDEGVKFGVLLIGEPGLGKTFLVEALEGELGYKCFKIAPVTSDLASPAQLLAAAKRAVEEVKQHAQTGKPCMFFIDEAESMMRSRKDPLSSIEQKTLTCYLLQEINEIRKKFPKVFLVAATNYIDEVDEAMLRPGRYDIRVFYGKPDANMRKSIIIGTLAKANIDTSFSATELEALVAATEGLKPLSLKQTIIDLDRFGPRLAKKRRQEFSFNFESLLAAYKKEVELLKHSDAVLDALRRKAQPTTGQLAQLNAPQQ